MRSGPRAFWPGRSFAPEDWVVADADGVVTVRMEPDTRTAPLAGTTLVRVWIPWSRSLTGRVRGTDIHPDTNT